LVSQHEVPKSGHRFQGVGKLPSSHRVEILQNLQGKGEPLPQNEAPQQRGAYCPGESATSRPCPQAPLWGPYPKWTAGGWWGDCGSTAPASPSRGRL